GKKLWAAELKHEANLYFEAASKLAADQPELHEYRALHALEQGENQQAEAALAQAVTLRKSLHEQRASQPPYTALAKAFDLLLENNQTEIAITVRELFHRIDPDN